MTLIVRTTGKFMLSPNDGVSPLFKPYRNTLTPQTEFVTNRINLGQLIVVAADVSEKANQADLDKFDSVDDYLKSLVVKAPTIQAVKEKAKA